MSLIIRTTLIFLSGFLIAKATPIMPIITSALAPFAVISLIIFSIAIIFYLTKKLSLV